MRGVVYMKEDLISWQIEEGFAYPEYGYHCNLFKEPMDGAKLRKCCSGL
jgi:hypothetical protein